MRSILVLGAGRSSSYLIDYLLENASKHNWVTKVGDLSEAAALERIGATSRGQFVPFNLEDAVASSRQIGEADVVISLLPAHLHPRVARFCLEQKRHLLTASYVSEEMASLNAQALSHGLLFLNECGLDPGIDHMTATQVIDKIRSGGGKVTSFESFTGGLISPETDSKNPWRYKFTWNPRNVVTAGQGTAKFLQDNKLKYIPYQQIFRRTTSVTVPGYGKFEGYANRDSLKYLSTYGLDGIKTMIRGTLRNEGFCPAWNVLLQLGCCDDSYPLQGVAGMTHADFLECFLPAENGLDLVARVALALDIAQDSPALAKLKWSGFFDEELVGLAEGTPAMITEHILNKKWRLSPTDRDMIVMWHRFSYEINAQEKQLEASLVVKGEDAVHTAMSKTVGLPLAIAAKLLLLDKIPLRGVQIPISPVIYEPILNELRDLGIKLKEEHVY